LLAYFGSDYLGEGNLGIEEVYLRLRPPLREPVIRRLLLLLCLPLLVLSLFLFFGFLFLRLLLKLLVQMIEYIEVVADIEWSP
jgi:hypothetical protein